MVKLNDYIINSLRNRSEFSNSQDIELEFVNCLEYEDEKYKTIQELIKEQKIAYLKSLMDPDDGRLADDLLIYLVRVDKVKNYVLIILDRYDLYETPSLLNIYRLSDAIKVKTINPWN